MKCPCFRHIGHTHMTSPCFRHTGHTYMTSPGSWHKVHTHTLTLSKIISRPVILTLAVGNVLSKKFPCFFFLNLGLGHSARGWYSFVRECVLIFKWFTYYSIFLQFNVLNIIIWIVVMLLSALTILHTNGHINKAFWIELKKKRETSCPLWVWIFERQGQDKRMRHVLGWRRGDPWLWRSLAGGGS